VQDETDNNITKEMENEMHSLLFILWSICSLGNFKLPTNGTTPTSYHLVAHHTSCPSPACCTCEAISFPYHFSRGSYSRSNFYGSFAQAIFTFIFASENLSAATHPTGKLFTSEIHVHQESMILRKNTYYVYCNIRAEGFRWNHPGNIKIC